METERKPYDTLGAGDYRRAEEFAALYKKCPTCGSEEIETRMASANAEGKQVPTGPTPYLIVECMNCKRDGKPAILAEILYH